jgi:hypothetical protein
MTDTKENQISQTDLSAGLKYEIRKAVVGYRNLCDEPRGKGVGSTKKEARNTSYPVENLLPVN